MPPSPSLWATRHRRESTAPVSAPAGHHARRVAPNRAWTGRDDASRGGRRPRRRSACGRLPGKRHAARGSRDRPVRCRLRSGRRAKRRTRERPRRLGDDVLHRAGGHVVAHDDGEVTHGRREPRAGPRSAASARRSAIEGRRRSISTDHRRLADLRTRRRGRGAVGAELPDAGAGDLDPRAAPQRVERTAANRRSQRRCAHRDAASRGARRRPRRAPWHPTRRPAPGLRSQSSWRSPA